jgi:hypothetical protein
MAAIIGSGVVIARVFCAGCDKAFRFIEVSDSMNIHDIGIY